MCNWDWEVMEMMSRMGLASTSIGSEGGKGSCRCPGMERWRFVGE